MPKKKVEVYENGQLIYPFIENDHVSFSNGMKISEMLNQSVSMPTVIHEGSSFKVGVGDEDVSSAIVDSSVSKMTIKGKTYQNILPEPSLRNSMTSGKSMQKLNEGYENVNVVDGVAKSAILKKGGAITLTASDYSFVGYVNDQDNQFGSEGVYYPSDTDRSTDYIDISSLGNKFSIIFNVPLKANSMYPYGYSHYSLFDKNKVVIKGANAKFTEETKTKLDVDRTNFPTAKYIRISLNVALNMDVVNGGTILQGEESPKISAFKNLLDYSLEPELKYFSPNGTWETTNTRTVNQVIPIETSTITFSFDEKIGDSYLRLGELDNSRRFIKRTLLNNTLTTVELDTNTKYVVFSIDKSDSQKFVNPKVITNTKSPFLTTIGKNLFNYQLEELNCYYNVVDSNGLKTNHAKVNTYFVEVLPNTTYTISYKSSSALGLSHIGYWDRKFIFMNGERDKKDYLTRTITTPPGCKYVSFPIGNTGVTDIQFEEGTQATSYAPYKINNLTVNEDVALRSNGNIYDELNLLTGQITQRIGEDGMVLSQEVVKTVNFSSSGNWEKVMLDGNGFGGADNGLTNTYRIVLTLPNAMDYRTLNDGGYDNLTPGTSSVDTKNIQISGGRLYIRIPKKDLLVASVDGAKEYLRQNPLTVWYQTTTTLDSTQVKEPIFFEDGHIQLSSEAENSSILTLDYQAKTSNSYTMDLMKTNTKYTMKAKSASGTFTIDGISYRAGINETFTTPTSLTNKLLVMNNKTNEEIMILEGDLTSKTIPYFKGIKSAFEGEDKIEVLSTGGNLCPPQPEVEGYYVQLTSGTFVRHDSYNVSKPIQVIEGQRYRLINTNKHHAYYDKNMNYLTTPMTSGSDRDFYSIAPKNAVYLRVSMMKDMEVIVNMDGAKGEYREPNITKIPLSSPLRSLPNGICDEIILDRENNKAKIIQRVGEAMVLETPVITEVDMEGFPYVYKGGYIFLNSEIAPTTEIVYSINQCQQISASNEDIIRHEKELTYLQKLIAQYVQVDYESVLLSLKA